MRKIWFVVSFLTAVNAWAINAPSNLAASATSSSQINLTWTDNSNNETGFKVERAPDSSGSPGTWSLIATLGQNVVSYSNTSLTLGTKFWYRVISYRPNQTGTSGNANATTLSPHHLSVTGFSSSITAGTQGSVTVNSLDVNNNLVNNFTGAVTFSSDDTQAVLPSGVNLTNGTGTFNATLKTAGTRSISALSSGVSGSQTGITVNHAATASFTVTLVSSQAVTCIDTDFHAVPKDAYGNTATSYSGTMMYTSTDPDGTLYYPFNLTGAGADFRHRFANVGSRTIVVKDQNNLSLTGTINVTVVADTAYVLSINYPTTTPVDQWNNLAVTAFDCWNNQATGYNGTVALTSNGSALKYPNLSLPQNLTLSGGTASTSAKFTNTGTYHFNATDTQNSFLTTQSAEIEVSVACVCPDLSQYSCFDQVYDNCSNHCGQGTGPGGSCDTSSAACGVPVNDQCGFACGTGTNINYSQCQYQNYCPWEQVYDNCSNYCGEGSGNCL